MDKNHQTMYWEIYDWEMLCDEWRITKDFDLSGYREEYGYRLEDVEEIKIYRDENYHINALALGEIKDTGPSSRSNIPEGTKLLYSSIKGYTDFYDFVELNPCYTSGETRSISLTGKPSSFKTNIIAYKVSRTSQHKADTYMLTEWFLNAPHSTLIFCENTSRTLEINATSQKVNFAKKDYRVLKHESHSNNTIYVEYGNTGFFVNQIEGDYSPKWSEKLSIEYSTEFGRIPDEDEREAIAELVGFLMGRNIYLVGHTEYDDSGNVLKSMACNPVGYNVKVECQRSSHELIPIHRYHNERLNFKKYMQKMLPLYLQKRSEFGLKDSLSRYWLAHAMPAGVNLPVLSSALEVIMSKWFKSNESNSHGVYLDRKDYLSAINSLLEEFEKIFDEKEYADKIKNRIANAYQMGVNEKFYVLLYELELQHGDAEKMAIKSRNIYAHGAVNLSENKLNELITNSNRYFLLFARVFLRILQYDGEYIDISVLGHPRKNITEKIGG